MAATVAAAASYLESRDNEVFRTLSVHADAIDALIRDTVAAGLGEINAEIERVAGETGALVHDLAGQLGRQ